MAKKVTEKQEKQDFRKVMARCTGVLKQSECINFEPCSAKNNSCKHFSVGSIGLCNK